MIHDIRELMRKDESENIEYKEKFDRETIETAVAFANTKGGVILIGFTDKGRVNGVQIGKETLNEMENQISQSTEPRIMIAQVFYDIGYIEKYGSGTIKIIDLCKQHGIPPPEFREVTGGFSVIFRKDIYTEEHLRNLGLNERQMKAVMYIKEKGRITNKAYQEINQVSRQTASRELTELCDKRILMRVGKTGKSTYYEIRSVISMPQTPHERLTNASRTG
jgi:ATP-dependent DNA helicase RecG